MTDEAFVFNQTVRERKAIGYGAYHKKRKGGRTIRFPSDNLSRRERQQMNGEVVSFDPRKFYTAEEFSMLPPEHKATLINGYISRYDVGLSNISEIVFGKSKTWLYNVLNKSGILPMIHIRTGSCTKKAKLALKADCEAYRGGRTASERASTARRERSAADGGCKQYRRTAVNAGGNRRKDHD
jgi:hypothetical protein